MPRIKILGDAEQVLFDHPPQLSGTERRHVFELPAAVWSAANEIQSAPAKIGFLVSAGYFRSARRFFLASDFYDRDIAYVAARLLDAELETMARSHSGPAQIFWRAVDWLVSRRIEIPTSFRLTEAVSRAIQQRARRGRFRKRTK